MKIKLTSLKAYSLVIIICLLLCVSIQAQRSTVASKSFHDYRPVGETRLWTYLLEDSTIGQLISTVEEEIKINGVTGYALNDRMYLDYGKVSDSLIFDISGQHFISDAGKYLGDDLKFMVNSQEEKLKFERDGDRISGYVTRAGAEVDFEIACPESRFAIDNNFMDHYEAYLALKDLSVGDSFSDSIFMPQSGMMGVIEGEVVEFSWQQLHRTLFDSVFVIRLTSPQNMEMFFTADKRLLKTNIHSINMRIYLDAVQQRPKSKSQTSTVSFGSIIRLLPQYGIFMLFGVITLLILYPKSLFSKLNMISFCAGVLSVVIVIWIQLPIQNYLFSKLYAPSLAVGEASYLMGLLTTLPAGIIQEGLKIAGIILIIALLNFKRNNSVTIGTFFGTGLGIGGAIYLISVVSPLGIFSWGLVERISWILFHAVSGALIGWAYYKGKNNLLLILVITTILNIFLRSLPFLSPIDALSLEMIFILNTIIVLIFFLISLFILRKETIS